MRCAPLLLSLGMVTLATCHRKPDYHIPPTGDFTLPTEWTECVRDADCTWVSLGCCSEIVVNHAHAKVARDALEESGRPYCPVKAACGPGPHGSMDGVQGTCTEGVCH